MKKVLVIHNKYRIFGGEDSNIEDELIFLKRFFTIKYLEFDNSKKFNVFDLIGALIGKNYKANKKLSFIIKEFNPDVAYVHNTWFKANLGIFKVLKKNNIKIILKIHNFRFSCTKNFLNNSHFGSESFCSKCGNTRKKSFFNKYFQESYLKSLMIILYGKKYLKILQDSSVNLLALNQFSKDILIKEGIDESKISIFNNPILISEKFNYQKNSNYVVYAGLINGQKGVHELIESWKSSKIDLKLLIFGDGILLNDLKNKNENKNIEFFGSKNHKTVEEYIKNSRAVITATKMFEGQPRILLEASKYGVPSIFPRYGGMIEYFPDNYKFAFEQFNYKDLEEKILLLLNEDILKNESIRVQNNLKSQINKNLLPEVFLNS